MDGDEEENEQQSVKDGIQSDDGINNNNNNNDNYYDDAMAVDRESIAVAIICRQLRIPFVVLKSIAPPRFNINANFKDLYENDDVTFDCTASIPLIKALLKEYTMYY